ncbi:MAG TPA: hypothetical protein VF306_19460 [Pirellulales bacterium]
MSIDNDVGKLPDANSTTPVHVKGRALRMSGDCRESLIERNDKSSAAAELRCEYHEIAPAIPELTSGWNSRFDLAMPSFLHGSPDVIQCEWLNFAAVELCIAPVEFFSPRLLPPYLGFHHIDAGVQSIRQDFAIALRQAQRSIKQILSFRTHIPSVETHCELPQLSVTDHILHRGGATVECRLGERKVCIAKRLLVQA